MRASVSRSLLVVSLAFAAAIGVSACGPSAPSPSTVPTDAAPVETPSATPTDAAPPADTPVDVACDALVPAQVVYDFNSNFGLQPGFAPEAGSAAETIATREGVVCAWENGTSGELIVVAAAHLPDDELTALKNDLVMTSNSVPTYGVEGYFQVTAGIGQVDAFSGPYWIVGSSTAFFEPGDASTIMEAAISALG